MKPAQRECIENAEMHWPMIISAHQNHHMIGKI